MKKLILLIFVDSLCFNNVKSQITKGNWMIGGNASFSFAALNTGTEDTKTTTLNLAPNIGYFFIDKFAGGIRLSVYRNHIKFGQPNNTSTTFTNYLIGPFVRYYFLPVDNQYNIIAEGSYQFGNEKVETNSSSNNSIAKNSLLFSAGPVIYFNSSVGIEFLLNYSSYGNNVNSSRGSSLGIGIGLQIHLLKDKN